MVLAGLAIPLDAESPFVGKRIAEIRYEPAGLLAPQDLEKAQRMKPGAPLDLDEVGRTIDRLFATGRFEDIQVDAEPSGPDGVTLRFLTKPAWFVGHVGVEGKSTVSPNPGQLANASQLNAGAAFQDADLDAAKALLKDLLESNGLYQATIEPRVERDLRTQTVNITFELNPGKRAKYAEPIVSGTPGLPQAAILRATGWRMRILNKWRTVTQERTSAGVAGILKKYQRQDRLTASIKQEKPEYLADENRVRERLDINRGPKLQVKALEAKVSKLRLRAYVPVYDEGAADRDLLVEGARNLRGYFQSLGYYDASVDFRPVQRKPDLLTVEYVIAQGPRYKLAHVGIEGNRYFNADVLRERMFLEPASLQYRHGRYSEGFLRKDEEAIANLYKANGFRGVKVTSAVENPYRGKANTLGVTFQVAEGPQWFVDELKVTGADADGSEGLVAGLSSSKGQPYSEVNIANDRNFLLASYYARGYPEAAFDYAAEPAGEPNRVKLTYRIAEGDKQFVRGVLLQGLTSTKEKLVLGHLRLAEGDPLSPTAVTAAQKKLYDLGVFAKVDASIQDPAGKADYKFVLYDFEEAQRYSVKVGIGAEIAQFGGTTNSLSSPGGSTGFSPRGSLDVTRLNVAGTGQSISLRGRISNLEQRASIEYVAPRLFDRGGFREGTNVTFSLLYSNTRDVRTFSSKRQEASVQAQRQLSRSLSGIFKFSYRKVSTGDVVIPALLVPQLLQPIRLGILSANFVQDKRDDPADAHRGVYNTIDLGLSANFFGSQRSFSRLLAKNATYHRLGKKLVIARQLQFGAISPFHQPAGISADDSVPLPERFFGGGSSSHRGFPFNQAGPRDLGTAVNNQTVSTQPTGFPLGGNALLFNTVEARFPMVGDNIGGVLFWDAGNVFKNLGEVTFRSTQKNPRDFDYMVHAAGFGIRYKTPIGPVRLDLAYSINPPSYVGFKGTQAELLTCNPAAAPVGVCQGVKQSIGHFQFSFSIGQAF